MIDDGLFTRFPMEAVFGMHNWPGMPPGKFGLTPGPIMASSNEFSIVIKGKGTHAGMPNLGIDPVMAAVQMAQSLQTIITRNRNPLDAAVLSITQIHAGSADNVVPNHAELRGTVRTFTLDVLDLIERRMEEIAHTCAAMDCEVEFKFQRNYPPTINHPDEAAFCAEVLRGIVGEDMVDDHVQPTMGAEDFAFMLQELPGCYVWIGNGMGEHRAHGHGLGPCMLHNGSYDFNDELLPLGGTYGSSWRCSAWPSRRPEIRSVRRPCWDRAPDARAAGCRRPPARSPCTSPGSARRRVPRHPRAAPGCSACGSTAGAAAATRPARRPHAASTSPTRSPRPIRRAPPASPLPRPPVPTPPTA